MQFPEMVWTQGPNGWHSRPLTSGDLERRALMRQWDSGEITYREAAAIVRNNGITALECGVGMPE